MDQLPGPAPAVQHARAVAGLFAGDAGADANVVARFNAATAVAAAPGGHADLALAVNALTDQIALLRAEVRANHVEAHNTAAELTNRLATDGPHRIIAKKRADGTVPAGFPATRADFVSLTGPQVSGLLAAYELEPPAAGETKRERAIRLADFCGLRGC